MKIIQVVARHNQHPNELRIMKYEKTLLQHEPTDLAARQNNRVSYTEFVIGFPIICRINY